MMPVTVTRDERAGRRGRIAVGTSAGILDATRQRILLIRRADSGRWAVPGGYMEPGESVTEGCEREVWEETGLRVRVGRLIAVYSDPDLLIDYPDGNRVQIVALHFAAEVISGSLRASDETTDARYFSQGGMLRLEMSEFNQQRIADTFAGQGTAFVRDHIGLE